MSETPSLQASSVGSPDDLLGDVGGDGRVDAAADVGASEGYDGMADLAEGAALEGGLVSAFVAAGGRAGQLIDSTDDDNTDALQQILASDQGQTMATPAQTQAAQSQAAQAMQQSISMAGQESTRNVATTGTVA